MTCASYWRTLAQVWRTLSREGRHAPRGGITHRVIPSPLWRTSPTPFLSLTPLAHVA